MPDRRWTRDGRETEDRCSRIVQGYYAKPMQLAAAAVVRIWLFDRVSSVMMLGRSYAINQTVFSFRDFDQMTSGTIIEAVS